MLSGTVLKKIKSTEMETLNQQYIISAIFNKESQEHSVLTHWKREFYTEFKRSFIINVIIHT